jgi:sugar lactone lactonase YvrE
MKKLLIILLSIPLFTNAQNTITTIAGTGIAGSTGDGSAATAAQIDAPGGIVFDAAGNIYFSDYYRHVIRKIDPSGNISTFAGTGSAGFSGDGGPASAARFYSPNKMSFDIAGNLFVADYNNNRVRKISTSGIITTIVGTGTIGSTGDGGNATAATLWHPSDVVTDNAGNVFIADYTNNKIRKISPTGIISTFAGTGSASSGGDGGAATLAQLYNPFDVEIDAAGNLLIAEAEGDKVRKVGLDGIISTFAGTGISGFSGDGGQATAANLSNPAGLEVDATGNLYIADQFNQRIRMVSPSGVITTIVGNGIAAYGGDGGSPLLASINYSNGVSVNAAGVVFIADNSNHRIRKIVMCSPSGITHPENDTVEVGDTAIYSITTTMPGAAHQWQEDTGTGFTNLADVPPYSGVYTSTLTISGATSSLNNHYYKCLITSETGCSYNTDSALLVITAETTKTSTVNSMQLIRIYPNPAYERLHIEGHTANTDYKIYDIIGKVLQSGLLSNANSAIELKHLSPGTYFIELNQAGSTRFIHRIVVSH